VIVLLQPMDFKRTILNGKLSPKMTLPPKLSPKLVHTKETTKEINIGRSRRRGA